MSWVMSHDALLAEILRQALLDQFSFWWILNAFHPTTLFEWLHEYRRYGIRLFRRFLLFLQPKVPSSVSHPPEWSHYERLFCVPDRFNSIQWILHLIRHLYTLHLVPLPLSMNLLSLYANASYTCRTESIVCFP